MKPLTRTILALALAAAFPLATSAQPKAGGAVATAPGAAGAVVAVSATATVEAVDPATRTVTLKNEKGETRTVVASEEVKNFDQIKKGDKVSLKYMEALTLELKKDGKAVVGRKDTESMKRAAPGQKPGGVATRETTIVADVVDVDAAKKTVTLKGPKGRVVDLNVQDPEQFKLIKKGDKVEAIYTEALAISMEPAAAPAKAPEKAPAKK